MNTEWKTEKPKESGYYLVTWKLRGDGRSKRVSEFWYSDNMWSPGRPYVEDGSMECLDYTDLVVAWMEKPEPFKRSEK